MRVNKYKIVQTLIIFIVITLAAGSITCWLNTAPEEEIIIMEPGLDNPPEGRTETSDGVFGEYHRVFSEKTETGNSGSWPGFRGPERNAVSTGKTVLADNWGIDGPHRLWQIELGEGHASPAVLNGYVYLLDYNEEKSMDMLRCFQLESGTEIWQTGYSSPIKRNHGRSRSIPYVTDDFVISMGPQGHLMAVSAKDGSLLWGRDIQAEYNSEIPLWYTAQCPLVTGSTVIAAVCGEEILVEAIDCLSGETVWSLPNDYGIKMSHASIIPVIIDGISHLVYAGLGGITGFTADGTILWYEPWNPAVIAPSPVQSSENRIFFTAGYGVGSMLLEVRFENGKWITERISEKLPAEGLACEQQTPVFYKGRLYAILPKDAGPHREEFACADPEGNILWTSGPLLRFGLGPWIAAYGRFFILKDDATLYMADAETDSWQLLDSAKIMDGTDAWGPMAIAGGYLLLRDSTRLVCLDLREESYR